MYFMYFSFGSGPTLGKVAGTMCPFLKGSMVPTSKFFIVGALLCVGQVSCNRKGCEFEALRYTGNFEPEGTPLRLGADILIFGLREVSKSGGSFGIDVE